MATTKKALLTVSVLALSILVALPAGSVIPTGFSKVVLFADNSIHLKKISVDEGSVQVGGDVVVNHLPAGEIFGADQLTVEKNVTITGDAKADSITVKKDATVTGSVFYNSLANSGSVGGEVTPLVLPVYSAMPIFETGVPGASDVVVPAGGSQDLAPGSYRDLIVGAGATLNLVVGAGGGLYHVNSISVADDGSLTADGFTRVTVADRIDLGKDTTVGAIGGAGARDVVFYIDGTGGPLNAADIGQRCVLDANIWARNGTVRVEKETTVTGAVLGENVQVEKDVTFTRATFFDETPIALDDSAEATEDGQVTIDVLANDTDPDGDPMAVVSVTQGANGSVSTGGADVDYVPNPDFFGQDSFSYKVCDNLLAINEDNCADATVTVDVTSVNDPPTAAADSLGPLDEDTSLIFSTADLLANDAAGPAGPPAEDATSSISLDSISGPANGHFTIPVGGDPITYTPNPNFNGTDTFAYTICDDGDGVDDPTILCSSGTVTVTVTPVNDPPVANSQDVFTSGDVDLPIALSAFDVDGDTMAFTLFGASPAEGALTPAASFGSDTASVVVVYNPTTDENKVDGFSFQVDDGSGTATALVRINPADDPEAPPESLGDVVAKADSVETLEETAVTIQLVGAAPCDPAGAADPTMPCDNVGNDVPLTFSLISGPTCVVPATCSAGSLSGITQGSEMPQRTATIDYTPAPGFSGTVSFVFQVVGDTNGDSDTADPGETSTATVTIGVEAFEEPDPPVVQDISSQTPLNTVVTIDLSTGSTLGASPAGGMCGNGAREEGEQCDDGNTVSGDGCSATCQFELLLTGPSAFAAEPAAVSTGSGDGQLTASLTETQTAGPPSTPVPLTVGAGWTATLSVPPAFFWTDDSPTFADDGPFEFTLSGAGCVSVTDDFLKGSTFKLYDGGTGAGDVIGATPAVAIDNSAPEVGPDAAYTDPSYSSGTFALAAGFHSIQIEVLNDVDGGRGYIRADLESDPICDGIIDTGGPRLTYRVQSVPDSQTEGTLRDSAGTIITAGYLLPDNLLKFEPASGFKGTVAATYDCIDNLTELISNIGILDWLVFDPNPGTGVGLTIDFQGAGMGDVTFDVGGSVVAICSADCTESFGAGEIIKLQARPIETGTFGGWGGDCIAGGTSQIYTITLPAAGASCTATFNP